MLLAWGVSIGVLVFDKDLGFALLIFGTVLVMLYIATERVSWLLIGSVLFVVGSYAAYHLFAHVRVRFDTWLDPFATYDTTGYQISQSLFGLGTGGVGGTGLGAGRGQHGHAGRASSARISIAMILILLAFPVLTAALFGLLADRKLGAHIFDPANGGGILWQHMFTRRRCPSLRRTSLSRRSGRSSALSGSLPC